MSKAKPKLNHSILLVSGATIGVVLVSACVLHGFDSWRRRKSDLRRRALLATDLVASQPAPLLVRRIDDPLREWARGLMTNPTVRLVAVHDNHGEIRTIETRSPALAKQAVWAEGMMSGLYAPKTWQVADENGEEYYGVMVPIRARPDEAPIGQLTMAYTIDDSLLATVSPLLGFYVPLTIVAVLAWWQATRQLFQHGVAPLSRLAKLASQSADRLPVKRQDQIGDLARVFQYLHEQVDHWRRESRDTELKAEKKMENQLRDFNRTLRQTERRAELDPLTGLNNRRIMDNHLDQLLREHRKRDLDMALVMIDVDNFKVYNDTHGHPAGDELLGFVGELLRKSSREQDLVIRVGGDEFALILPVTSAQAAAELGQRIISLFGQYAKTLPATSRSPGMSCGIAGMRATNAVAGSELLLAADEALYRAKAEGKGKVALAGPIRNVVSELTGQAEPATAEPSSPG